MVHSRTVGGSHTSDYNRDCFQAINGSGWNVPHWNLVGDLYFLSIIRVYCESVNRKLEDNPALVRMNPRQVRRYRFQHSGSSLKNYHL